MSAGLRTFEIRICDDCYVLKGKMCHNPECVFIRRTMTEVSELLDTLLIRPIVDGERFDLHPLTAAALDGQGDAAALPTGEEKGQPVKYETHRLAVRKLEQMHADIEKAWQMIHNCYDVEPREYFEREARRNGFDSPLAQAIFHVHKRDKREAAGDVAPLVAPSKEKDDAGLLGSTDMGKSDDPPSTSGEPVNE